ncbi:MAG TPA: branched-chain amino acid ABC transporter permease [Acidimicrobiia bacterium]|nr:branched-chain amino acid ABC transporter permease [Acidimicrobiia bacterium]
MVPYITSGLVTGTIYALAALGVAIVYKGSRVLNFAHGSIATAGVLVFSKLFDRIPVGLAVLVGVATGVILGVLSDLVVFRPLSRSREATKVMASVALLALLQAIILPRFEGRFLHLFPTTVLRAGGFSIGIDQIMVITLTVGLTLLLGLFFRANSWGIAIRAVADDARSTALVGVAPSMVSAVAWGLGGGLAALSGILLAPFVYQDPILLTLIVIHAMAAVVIGVLESLPVIFAGAIALGLVESLGTRWITVPGYNDVVPLVAILLTLVFLAQRKRTSWRPA